MLPRLHNIISVNIVQLAELQETMHRGRKEHRPWGMIYGGLWFFDLPAG